MIYYTHGGAFHCDEVAGYSICKVAGICDRFERLSNVQNIPSDGIIADIGRVYDHQRKIYDHHQDFLLRANGYPYASAGLLWKHYGHLAVSKVIGVDDSERYVELIEKIVEAIDESIFQGIDASDSDSQYSLTASCVGGEVVAQSISDAVSAFNHKDVLDEVAQVVNFRIASNFFAMFLESKILSTKKRMDDYERFKHVAFFEGDILTLSEGIAWREVVHNEYPHVKFVISPSTHPGNPFSMIAVSVKPNSREIKVPIERPEWFEGFIHQGKWIAGAKTVNELKRLAEYNLMKSK